MITHCCAKIRDRKLAKCFNHPPSELSAVSTTRFSIVGRVSFSFFFLLDEKHDQCLNRPFKRNAIHELPSIMTRILSHLAFFAYYLYRNSKCILKFSTLMNNKEILGRSAVHAQMRELFYQIFLIVQVKYQWQCSVILANSTNKLWFWKKCRLN